MSTKKNKQQSIQSSDEIFIEMETDTGERICRVSEISSLTYEEDTLYLTFKGVEMDASSFEFTSAEEALSAYLQIKKILQFNNGKIVRIF